ncbi:hypothetical protein ACFSC4_22875 [Deinococcus malanensis]|uniref:hypothetical protein n=1 Tax=Deinococcus malanensis TaxID=1706855 RepID=UPI00362E1EC1
MFRRSKTSQRMETRAEMMLRLIAQDVAGHPLAEVWVQLPSTAQHPAQQAVDLSALMNHPANWQQENWPGQTPDPPKAFVSQYAAHLMQQGAQVQPGPSGPDTPFLTVRAHIPAELLVRAPQTDDQHEGTSGEEPPAHACSLNLGAVALQVAGRDCVISGLHSRERSRLDLYVPWIQDAVTHGLNTSLLLKQRDTRDGSEYTYIASQLNLPGCPHARLGLCEHLSDNYFDAPHYQAGDQTLSHHRMTVEALAVLDMGPSFRTHLHVFEPGAPSLQPGGDGYP